MDENDWLAARSAVAWDPNAIPKHLSQLFDSNLRIAQRAPSKLVCRYTNNSAELALDLRKIVPISLRSRRINKAVTENGDQRNHV